VKINEVISEGPLNFLRQKFTPSYKPKNEWAQKWLKQPNANDPQALQKYATQISTDSQGNVWAQAPVPTDLTPQGIDNYLTAITNEVHKNLEVAKTYTPKTPEPPSEFMKQFKFDPEFGVITRGKTAYQRDENGQWIDLASGKPVPQRFIPMLDKISPPAQYKTRPQDVPGAWWGQKPKSKE
jgi:hypothetical protein